MLLRKTPTQLFTARAAPTWDVINWQCQAKDNYTYCTWPPDLGLSWQHICMSSNESEMVNAGKPMVLIFGTKKSVNYYSHGISYVTREPMISCARNIKYDFGERRLSVPTSIPRTCDRCAICATSRDLGMVSMPPNNIYLDVTGMYPLCIWSWSRFFMCCGGRGSERQAAVVDGDAVAASPTKVDVLPGHFLSKLLGGLLVSENRDGLGRRVIGRLIWRTEPKTLLTTCLWADIGRRSQPRGRSKMEGG
jgi:hypothetical protein